MKRTLLKKTTTRDTAIKDICLFETMFQRKRTQSIDVHYQSFDLLSMWFLTIQFALYVILNTDRKRVKLNFFLYCLKEKKTQQMFKQQSTTERCSSN